MCGCVGACVCVSRRLVCEVEGEGIETITTSNFILLLGHHSTQSCGGMYELRSDLATLTGNDE